MNDGMRELTLELRRFNDGRNRVPAANVSTVGSRIADGGHMRDILTESKLRYNYGALNHAKSNYKQLAGFDAANGATDKNGFGSIDAMILRTMSSGKVNNKLNKDGFTGSQAAASSTARVVGLMVQDQLAKAAGDRNPSQSFSTRASFIEAAASHTGFITTNDKKDGSAVNNNLSVKDRARQAYRRKLKEDGNASATKSTEDLQEEFDNLSQKAKRVYLETGEKDAAKAGAHTINAMGRLKKKLESVTGMNQSVDAVMAFAAKSQGTTRAKADVGAAIRHIVDMQATELQTGVGVVTQMQMHNAIGTSRRSNLSSQGISLSDNSVIGTMGVEEAVKAAAFAANAMGGSQQAQQEATRYYDKRRQKSEDSKLTRMRRLMDMKVTMGTVTKEQYDTFTGMAQGGNQAGALQMFSRIYGGQEEAMNALGENYHHTLIANEANMDRTQKEEFKKRSKVTSATSNLAMTAEERSRHNLKASTAKLRQYRSVAEKAGMDIDDNALFDSSKASYLKTLKAKRAELEKKVKENPQDAQAKEELSSIARQQYELKKAKTGADIDMTSNVGRNIGAGIQNAASKVIANQHNLDLKKAGGMNVDGESAKKSFDKLMGVKDSKEKTDFIAKVKAADGWAAKEKLLKNKIAEKGDLNVNNESDAKIIQEELMGFKGNMLDPDILKETMGSKTNSDHIKYGVKDNEAKMQGTKDLTNADGTEELTKKNSTIARTGAKINHLNTKVVQGVEKQFGAGSAAHIDALITAMKNLPTHMKTAIENAFKSEAAKAAKAAQEGKTKDKNEPSEPPVELD